MNTLLKSIFVAAFAFSAIALTSCEDPANNGTDKNTNGNNNQNSTNPGEKTTLELLTAHPWQHISSVYQYPASWDDPDTAADESIRVDDQLFGTITFGTNGFAGDMPYSLSGQVLTVTFPGDGETPFVVNFNITKLTDTEFEGVANLQGLQDDVINEPENRKSRATTYNYTWTVKFVKP